MMRSFTEPEICITRNLVLGDSYQLLSDLSIGHRKNSLVTSIHGSRPPKVTLRNVLDPRIYPRQPKTVVAMAVLRLNLPLL